MKIAISQRQGRISPVFDVAEGLLLVDIEDDKILARRQLSLTRREPFARAKEIVDLGVELLVCGAISNGYEKVLIQSGIHVIGFCCGELEAVLRALKKGRFGAKRFRMPGFNGRKSNSGISPPTGAGRGKCHGAARRNRSRIAGNIPSDFTAEAD